MLTSQAFRDTFPLLLLSYLKVAGALLKDSPCSFSLGDYATAQNRPELLAQPPIVGILPKKCRVTPSHLDKQTAICDTWHRPFHPDGNSHSFHPDISHPEFCPADVPPSPDISHPEFCRWMGEEDDSNSPGRHVRILR